MDANNVEAILGLARVYATLGDQERAVATYKKATAKHPKNGQVWYDVGMYHSRQRNYAAAVTNLQKALEYDPENRNYAKALAVCLAASGQIQQSQQVLTRLYGDAKAALNLARTLDRLGRTAQVVQAGLGPGGGVRGPVGVEDHLAGGEVIDGLPVQASSHADGPVAFEVLGCFVSAPDAVGECCHSVATTDPRIRPMTMIFRVWSARRTEVASAR